MTQGNVPSPGRPESFTRYSTHPVSDMKWKKVLSTAGGRPSPLSAVVRPMSYRDIGVFPNQFAAFFCLLWLANNLQSPITSRRYGHSSPLISSNIDMSLAGGLVFFSFWVLLGSSGFFWRSSGVLLAFFCVIEHQKNARRTPEEHQKNTRRNARRTQKNPEGEEHQPPLHTEAHVNRLSADSPRLACRRRSTMC